MASLLAHCTAPLLALALALLAHSTALLALGAMAFLPATAAPLLALASALLAHSTALLALGGAMASFSQHTARHHRWHRSALWRTARHCWH
jgi:hypothetical protein